MKVREEDVLMYFHVKSKEIYQFGMRRKSSAKKNIPAVLPAEKVDSSLFSYFTKAMRSLDPRATGEKAVT
jgi:hypothetical protein